MEKIICICSLLCGVFLIFQDFYNFQFSFSLIWKIKIRKKILQSLIHGVYCHFQQFYRYKMHIMTTIQCILWLPIFLVSNTIYTSHYVLVVQQLWLVLLHLFVSVFSRHCLSFCPFLLVTVLSVLLFTATDYHFGIFKLSSLGSQGAWVAQWVRGPVWLNESGGPGGSMS